MKSNKCIRYALVLAGLLSLTGCKDEEKKQVPILPKKEVKVEKLQQTAFDETYDEILKNYSGSTYHLNAGVYKGEACIKIGPGVPITKEELKNLPFDEKDYDDLKVKKGEETRLRPKLARTHVKNFVKNKESEYRLLCQRYEMDYDKLPAKARASIFCIDMVTGGKIEKYPKFLTALAKENWKEAARQSYVSYNTYQKANPSIPANKATEFNRNMKELFRQLQQKKEQKQNIWKQKNLSGKTH